MCLSVPAQIVSLEGDMAQCAVGGVITHASIQMIAHEDLKIGDFVLLHTGFALQKISEEEAVATLALFEEFETFNQSLDEEEKKTGQRIV